MWHAGNKVAEARRGDGDGCMMALVGVGGVARAGRGVQWKKGQYVRTHCFSLNTPPSKLFSLTVPDTRPTDGVLSAL